MGATEAQVAAAMEALGCDRIAGQASGGPYCQTHQWIGKRWLDWSDRGCSHAVSVADAVVAAGPDPAKVAAEAVREAADAVPLFEFMLVMDVASEVAPGQIAAWLRARADRIETGQ